MGRSGDAAPRTFFGEPRALAYLAFTEAWERFSYYGMGAILVLYMTQALFLPGRIHGVAGFDAFRGTLEGLFGPMTRLGLASQVFGLYTAFVYFTPVVGGWLADRFIGRRRAVALGALLMSGGHFAMAFDQSFLLALGLLIVGCGLLKGNITAQVGALYRRGDGAGRTRGFSIFYMGVNGGAVLGPLIVGYLADRYGWHWGFGLAGVLMLAGLATYLAGYRLLPERRPDDGRDGAKRPMTGQERTRTAALLTVIAVTVLPTIGYYQSFNMGLVWIDAAVDRDLLGFTVPAAWFNTIDAAASIVFVPPLFALWRLRESYWPGQGELGKIADGAWITAGANLLLAGACLAGGRIGMGWPASYKALLGVGFLFCWPPLFALISRLAPARINATMMGVSFLSIFVANNLIGWLGRFYERMPPAAFWALHAAIAAAGALLALVLRRPLARVLAAGPDEGVP